MFKPSKENNAQEKSPLSHYSMTSVFEFCTLGPKLKLN